MIIIKLDDGGLDMIQNTFIREIIWWYDITQPNGDERYSWLNDRMNYTFLEHFFMNYSQIWWNDDYKIVGGTYIMGIIGSIKLVKFFIKINI